MKRLIISMIILIAGYYYECPAQWIKSYGVKVALTSAHDGYESNFFPDERTKRRIGVGIGGFIEWFDDPILSVITQIEYVQKGSGMIVKAWDENNEYIGTTTYYTRLDYISIPIFVKFRIRTPILIPYVITGPRFDFFLGDEPSLEPSAYYYKEYKKNVKGASIGFGIQTINPHTNVLAEIRYNLDFEDSYSNRGLKLKNNSYDLWLGLSF